VSGAWLDRITYCDIVKRELWLHHGCDGEEHGRHSRRWRGANQGLRSDTRYYMAARVEGD